MHAYSVQITSRPVASLARTKKRTESQHRETGESTSLGGEPHPSPLPRTHCSPPVSGTASAPCKEDNKIEIKKGKQYNNNVMCDCKKKTPPLPHHGLYFACILQTTTCSYKNAQPATFSGKWFSIFFSFYPSPFQKVLVPRIVDCGFCKRNNYYRGEGSFKPTPPHGLQHFCDQREKETDLHRFLLQLHDWRSPLNLG